MTGREKYLSVLRQRFPLPDPVERELKEQRGRLDGEIGAARQSRPTASPRGASESEEMQKAGLSGTIEQALPDQAAAHEEKLRRAEDVGYQKGLEEGRRSAETDSKTKAVESRDANRKRFGLELFAKRCRDAGIESRLDGLVARLRALEDLSSLGAASGDTANMALRAEHESAVAKLGWVLSGELYSLIGQLRAGLRAGSDAFTASDFNETGQRLAKSMNDRLFGGRALMVAEPERVAADDALHEFASGSAGRPMQPATFRLTDGAERTTRRAIVVPQSGGGG